MSNPKSLKPFQKGFDKRRNVSGSKKNLWPELREAIERNSPEGVDPIIKALIRKAKKGSDKSIAEILDRYYGKAKQSVEVHEVNNVSISPKQWVQ